MTTSPVNQRKEFRKGKPRICFCYYQYAVAKYIFLGILIVEQNTRKSENSTWRRSEKQPWTVQDTATTAAVEAIVDVVVTEVVVETIGDEGRLQNPYSRFNNCKQ